MIKERQRRLNDGGEEKKIYDSEKRGKKCKN